MGLRKHFQTLSSILSFPLWQYKPPRINQSQWHLFTFTMYLLYTFFRDEYN
jgi:hypothetical protein